MVLFLRILYYKNIYILNDHMADIPQKSISSTMDWPRCPIRSHTTLRLWFYQFKYATRLSLVNIMLSERSQTQKATYYVILFIWNDQNWQIQTQKKVNGCQGLMGGKIKKNYFLVPLNGTRLRWLLQDIMNVLNTTEFFTLKWWTVYYVSFYSISYFLKNMEESASPKST